MTTKEWQAVDAYLEATVVGSDDTLQAALAANEAADLPAIDVSPAQGKLLHLLARMAGAKRILEIGTLGGYSTIWLARALPDDGRLVSLEAAEEHAVVARANIVRAGLAEKVEIRVAPALEILPRLVEEGQEPFDFIFIDADKPNNPAYLTWALKLSRPGTVILGDNVVRDGKVRDPQSSEPGVVGTRRFLEMIGEEPRLSATAIQTVGAKGWDGFVLAVVA
ncbi:O-methyltransferase [Afifella marina]|uniref:Predicted O-methyltransferase YrrM n=1 Tax=Afifella marina DSM 2698 TaxID=1120955 RepID=A0A1G5NE98_AFIMA|nr:O-methyltransferase [Afifella marina]MBK1623258.1 O-methyltransferase [Afifella marina DSM 2698]MBK1626252.1 O-methyltransferase [Afifella marina]MBK5917130.1 methyltransferase [Afifella marina]RAI22112.1 methyltransferase [Afifella marina DSM 2698]SCZ34920.1 Predicted O-methyltransferase YrrM [Afifella marina DSM 2698]